MSDPTGAEDARTSKGLLRRGLDVCVFAPVGMVVTVAEDLPDLVAKGKARVEQDLSNARFVGRFVVHREWRRLSQHLAGIFGSGRGPGIPSAPDESSAPDETTVATVEEPDSWSGAAGSVRGSVAPPEEASAAASDLTPDTPPVTLPAGAPIAPSAPGATGRPPVPDAAAEAIVGAVLADYDTLSASQVVRRLESLGPEELRAVQRYEASTRNRRTILNRASQLLDQGPAAAHSG